MKNTLEQKEALGTVYPAYLWIPLRTSVQDIVGSQKVNSV